METKRERFVRLAENRTNKIINMVRLLGNCSNRSAYEFDKDDVQQIFASIEEEVKNAKSKFLQADDHNQSTFKLREKV